MTDEDQIDGLFRISRSDRVQIEKRSAQALRRLPELDITHVSFNLFKYEELCKISVCTVTNPDTYGSNSVNDRVMGVVDRGYVCYTCRQPMLSCPGHIGMIKLNVPILHPMYYSEIIYILRSVCNCCGALLLRRREIEKKGLLKLTGKKRLKAIAELSVSYQCRANLRGCDVKNCIPNPSFETTKTKSTGRVFFTRVLDDEKLVSNLPTESVLDIFQAISEEDVKLLGFSGESHPADMVLQALPIAAPNARPSVHQDGHVLEDDLTRMYQDIIRYNNDLGKPTLNKMDRDKYVDNLIFYISHMLNNSDNKYSQGRLNPYTCIRARIQGKDALIRGKMMGKRVDFSARTVLSPDPTLEFGQVRVPYKMARYLTFPEVVTTENYVFLMALFVSGKIVHLRPSSGKLAGERIRVTRSIVDRYKFLRFGDVVEREMLNGDTHIFDRNPSLHKYSLMAYQVVISYTCDTFGLRLDCTIPHNADFDGDEGSLHAPQSYRSAAEMAGVMSVKNNIISTQNNKPVFGAVMDGVVGLYLLTRSTVVVSESLYSDLIDLMKSSDHQTIGHRCRQFDIDPRSGTGTFSALLPVGLNYIKDGVRIVNGVMISGQIKKKHVGDSHGSLVQVIHQDFGALRTCDFLTDISRMADRYLETVGFSIGLEDCMLSYDDKVKGRNHPEVEQEIHRASLLVSSLGNKTGDQLHDDQLERKICAQLNTVVGLGTKISGELLDDDNAFNVMANSGAKGNAFHICSMVCMLGQQYIAGRRLPLTMSEGNRSMPYYAFNSKDPGSRGFVKNSFMTGLTPPELFAHQAAGRPGLIDTAIKTADTGYLSHTMYKAMEDLIVDESGLVRNHQGAIFQFVYGLDGFDPGKLERVSIRMSNVKTVKREDVVVTESKVDNYTCPSFIDIRRVCRRINTTHGFSC